MIKIGVKYSQLYSHLITSAITILHYETFVSPTIVVYKMKRALLHLTY